MSIDNFNINRRHFLKGATAGAVLSSFGMYGFDLVHREKPWRVGLIGCGWYGTSDLFKIIQVANVEVIALCDVDSKFLMKLPTGFSTSKIRQEATLYTDYRKMLAEGDLEIVLIGSPDHWHALQGIEAMKAGAHVYLQKPISVDVLEGEALVAAARKYDRVVQIGTQRKSTPHLTTRNNKW